MRNIVKASLLLVAGVTVLNLLMLLTDFHKSFAAGPVVFVVLAIVLNIAAVYWALKNTASANGYLAQLLTALGIGLLAGFIIVMVSWFLLAVAFPDAIDDFREAALAQIEASGTPEPKASEQREAVENATPFSQALPGGPGTLITSLVAGAVIAIFRRRRASGEAGAA